MLRFFRHIRKSLMEQNKIRTYLFYAIGEILLVVIGILIALQVNNWNEQRKARNISEEAITNLRVELEAAKAHLEQVMPFNERIINESELFLIDRFKPDSLNISAGRIFYLTNFAAVTLEMPILHRELTSDNLIIGNEDIKEKLRQISESQQMSMEIKRYLDDFWNSQITPYYVKTQTMVDANRFFSGKEFDEASAEMLLSDKEYKNLVAMTNLGLTQFINVYKNLIRLMDETIQIIEKRD